MKPTTDAKGDSTESPRQMLESLWQTLICNAAEYRIQAAVYADEADTFGLAAGISGKKELSEKEEEFRNYSRVCEEAALQSVEDARMIEQILLSGDPDEFYAQLKTKRPEILSS